MSIFLIWFWRWYCVSVLTIRSDLTRNKIYQIIYTTCCLIWRCVICLFIILKNFIFKIFFIQWSSFMMIDIFLTNMIFICHHYIIFCLFYFWWLPYSSMHRFFFKFWNTFWFSLLSSHISKKSRIKKTTTIENYTLEELKINIWSRTKFLRYGVIRNLYFLILISIFHVLCKNIISFNDTRKSENLMIARLYTFSYLIFTFFQKKSFKHDLTHHLKYYFVSSFFFQILLFSSIITNEFEKKHELYQYF